MVGGAVEGTEEEGGRNRGTIEKRKRWNKETSKDEWWSANRNRWSERFNKHGKFEYNKCN